MRIGIGWDGKGQEGITITCSVSKRITPFLLHLSNKLSCLSRMGMSLYERGENKIAKITP